MRISLLLLSFVFTSIALAATRVLPYKQDVNIDGKNKEWQSPLPGYDKKTGINFDIANDVNHLFFILRIVDNSLQQQILQNGLEVWINLAGKKKKTTGVTFPLPIKSVPSENRGVQSSSGERQRERKTEENGQSIRSGLPLPHHELLLSGFLIDNGRQSTKDCPVRTAISFDDSGCLIYELAVPFNTFFKEQLETDDTRAVFCIGFIAKNTSAPNDVTMPVNMMGGYRSGLGGPGSMMGRPGMMGGPQEPGGTSLQGNSGEKKYWFKVTPSISTF